MKKLLSALTLLGLFAGCDPIVPHQDKFTAYPQVHLTDWWYSNTLRVQPPVATRVGSGQLEVAIPIRNLTDSEVLLDYQYRFLSKAGTQVEQPSGWHMIRVPSKGFAEIHFTSMTAMANDFDCDIRPAK